MNRPMIDALARRTSALQDRRTSLAALGAGVLAATAIAPRTAEGKQSCGKKVKKKCKQLASDCEAQVRSVCQDECLQALLPCCQSLAACDAGAAAACFLGFTSVVCCQS
jgi:hypothetical protein